MRKGGWSCLLIGFLLTTAVACKSLPEDDINEADNGPTPITTATEPVSQQLTITSPVTPESTKTEPPQPTPLPTSRLPDNWKQIGSSTTGLQISVPPEWVNLSGRLDPTTMSNLLGLIVLLVSDSERTGESVLAGKDIATGAFVVGITTHLDPPVEMPMAGLERILTQIGSAVTPSSEVNSFTPTASSGVTGAYIDVTGDPAGLLTAGGQILRTRILLFTSPGNQDTPAGNTQAIFLLSAPASAWDSYDDTFARMMDSIIIHNIQTSFVINEGKANILGNLQAQTLVNGDLDRGTKDIWTFNTEVARYATLTLKPNDENIDLTLTLIGPSGQTVARIDSGYAGTTERVTDMLLVESGLYIVEVGEFFNEPGRYTLNLVLTEEPLFSGGGGIEVGQSIQSELPANGQHVWTFEGVAGQFVSVVLVPGNEQFDAILDLYGPDGRRLVALDEGFSGDAEVISGFQLAITGQYSILVRSFAGHGGAYTLSLDEGGDSTLNFYDAGDLVYGETTRETLQINEAHAWFFEGRAGDQIVIKAVPINEELDLDVWLLDPDIIRIAARDKFLAGQAEMIEHILPVDGQYLILVRDFFGKAGEYEVSLMATPVRIPDYAGTLLYGQEVAGMLAAEQTVYWLFDGKQDTLIDVNLAPLGENTDLAFTLQDPHGITVLEVDTSLNGVETLDAFAVTADGQWRIVVREFFGEAGDYALTVSLSQ